MKALRGGRLYRVTGASSQSGEDVEITVEAYDGADAARAANRQGVFVSGCVAAGADGSDWAASAPPAAPPQAAPAAAPPRMTFAETVAQDPVIQRLVRINPQLGYRVKRLNEEDQSYLATLVGEQMGISYRDSAHVGKLMSDADQWKQP
jgi:hypothetical protein